MKNRSIINDIKVTPNKENVNTFGVSPIKKTILKKYYDDEEIDEMDMGNETSDSEVSTQKAEYRMVDDQVSFRIGQNKNIKVLGPGLNSAVVKNGQEVDKEVKENSESERLLHRDGFVWVAKKDFYAFFSKNIKEIILELLAENLLIDKREVLGNGDCMFNAILGQGQSNELTSRLREKVADNVWKLYRKAIKGQDTATLATIHKEVNTWYAAYSVEIERLKDVGISLKNQKFLVKTYCTIMKQNHVSRVSWGDYDLLSYCNAFEHLHKVIICLYPTRVREDNQMCVYVHVPKSKTGDSLSKQFVQNVNNYSIIIFEGDHFSYYKCDENFKKRINEVSNGYKVCINSGSVNISSPSRKISQKHTGVMEIDGESDGNISGTNSMGSGVRNKEVGLSKEDHEVAFSEVMKDVKAETKICNCNNASCSGGRKWETVRGRIQHEINSIRADNIKCGKVKAKVISTMVKKKKAKKKVMISKVGLTSTAVKDDEFEKVIQEFVEEEIIGMGNGVSSLRQGCDSDIMEVISDLANVFEGSYKLELDQLSIEDVINRFLLKQNPKIYKNEVISKHTLNRIQQLVINLVNNSDISNRYNHVALMLLPVIMKLVRLSLNLWEKNGIGDVHQILDLILGCTEGLQSLIVLRLYEILYVPKELRNTKKVGNFTRKNQKYKYIKELTGLKSYGKAFRVLQQPEVSSSIEKEVIPSLISKYFPDGAAKVELEEETSEIVERVASNRVDGKIESINSHVRFDDVCTIEEEISNKVEKVKSKEVPMYGEVGNDFTITEADVELALKRVNLASATGVDVWTYSLIKSLWFSKGSKNIFGKAIAQLMTKLVKGEELDTDIGNIWSLCRTIFIPKEVVEKKVISYRPIGITSCWYRLVGKVVSNIVKDKVAATLVQYKQLGIGIPDGCAITAKVLVNYLKEKEGNVFIKTDIKNAFNETPHYLIRKGLAKVCPELLPFFEFIYANNPLLIYQGEVVGTLTQGTLQGDSLSMIYFNAALHVVLEKLKKVGGGEIIAYCDDVFILGNSGNIDQYKEDAWEMFEKHGLTISREKSKLVDINTNEIILGVPMGTKEYIDATIASMVEDIRAKIKIVNDTKLETKTRLIFIKACINTCPVFISRILRLDKAVCLELDGVVDSGLSSLVQRDITKSVAASIRGLPQKLGGLGIYRYELFSKALYEGLRVKTNEFMKEHFPGIGEEEMVIGDEEVSGVIGNIDIKTWNSVPQEGRHLCMLQRVFDEVHNKLLSDKYLVAGAALLISNCYENSAYHLTHYYGFQFKSDSKYIACLQNRLLISIDECYHNLDCCCKDKGYKGENLENEHRQCLFPLSHMFNCKRNSGYMIAVHDHVSNGIKDFVKSHVNEGCNSYY